MALNVFCLRYAIGLGENRDPLLARYYALLDAHPDQTNLLLFVVHPAKILPHAHDIPHISPNTNSWLS